MHDVVLNTVDGFTLLGGQGGAGQQATAGGGVDKTNMVEGRMDVSSHDFFSRARFAACPSFNKVGENSRIETSVKDILRFNCQHSLLKILRL